MIEIADNKCDFCSDCFSICPPDCSELEEENIRFDDDTCIDCDLCVYVCPLEVLSHHDTEES